MAYDEELAARVLSIIGSDVAVVQKRMFGGLGLMVNGNLAVVIRGKGGLMVRADPASEAKLLAERGAAVAEMRGRPMRGWFTVEPEGYARAADLRRWVNRGVATAGALPAKAS